MVSFRINRLEKDPSARKSWILTGIALYNNKILTELSDRAMFTNPISIARLVSARTFHRMAREQPERYAALERAGFKVDPFGDIQDAINIRLGGHYIDVGTSAKIGQGFVSHYIPLLVHLQSESVL